jgi:hypothetical protein
MTFMNAILPGLGDIKDAILGKVDDLKELWENIKKAASAVVDDIRGFIDKANL